MRDGSEWSQSPPRATTAPHLVAAPNYAERGYPRFGELVARAGDVNGDGVPDFVVGDPAGWDSSGLPMLWIVSGKDGSVLRRVVLPHPFLKGERLDGGVDVDNDGVPDFFVAGEPYEQSQDTNDWRTVGPTVIDIVSGRDGSIAREIATQGRAEWNTDWVRFVGDFDHDGVRDIGVLERGTDEQLGVLAIYSSSSGARVRELPINAGCGRPGAFVQLGDMDADGAALFAVMLAGTDQCRASLRLCSSAMCSPLWEFPSPGRSMYAQYVLAVVGDIDGDGVPDLAASFIDSVDVLSGKTGKHLLGFAPSSEGFGCALASLGDIDGDGVPDFAIGDAYHGWAQGAIFARSGKDGRDLWTVTLPLSDGLFHIGSRLVAIGDVNGDGITDLVAGSRSGESGDPGLACLVSGRDGASIFALGREGDDVVVVRAKPKPAD
jgi:hypothetical protein